MVVSVYFTVLYNEPNLKNWSADKSYLNKKDYLKYINTIVKTCEKILTVALTVQNIQYINFCIVQYCIARIREIQCKKSANFS